MAEITAHLSLPLPSPANTLAVDVLRIREAFTALDAKIAALDTLLSSDDVTLDSVQELVAAIKASQTEMGAVTAQVAAQLAVQDAQVAAQLTAQDAQVAAQLADLSALVYAGL